MPGGILWRTVSKSGNSFSGGPVCGQVQKVAYDGTILWNFIYSTTEYCTHHDICPMPNGNVLLISYESKTAAEVTAAGSSYSGTMWPDKIVEVKPTGATTGDIVWEWHTWDHLVQNTKPTAANYQSSIVDHPELININYKATKDWQHMNGVDYNPILDQVTFSSHNFSEIYVIDHSTTTAEAASHKGGNSGKGGDILYRWGNPAAYGASGSQILNVTHDAHWIPEGSPNAGYLVAYNNKGISSQASCADQVAPPIDGYNYTRTAGAAYQPASYTSRQASGGYNSNMGSSQQLPNGNTLICVATSGTINEFSPTGTKLWTRSMGGSCAKAYRYSKCYVENAAPAIPVITVNDNKLTSTSATTYQWYCNGVLISGATGKDYTPVKNGIYVVRITDSNGCVYMYSAGITFTGATGIFENELEQKMAFYPNPTSGIVNIDNTQLYGASYEIRIFDPVGKLIGTEKNATQINLSAYENGIYFLQVSDGMHSSFTRKISIIK
ncbi:MAG TPA: aryl-sulfate sulfotransferase [Bacteroidia bacterium]|nr:aryl-sulfate sulfotransferase [Bacteroidia bacterium]